MFLLQWIPDVIFHVLTFFAIVGVGFFLSPFSFIVPNKNVFTIIAVAIFGICMYGQGGITERAIWKKKMLALEVELARVETAAANVTVETITKYVTKTKIIKEKGDVIVKEVPVYITKESDDSCIIPDGFRVLHNAAIDGKIPDAPGDTNAAPTAIKLSGVAEVIVKNYSIHNQVVEQLKSLQEWIREQEKIHNK